jgi:putative toxin-antitoxin system antitoxin component (TIGR02293 family)
MMTDEEAILAKAVKQAADRLGIQASDLSPAISGVRFVRLFRSLDSILGGDETVARAWLRAPCMGLNQQRPLDLMSTPEGFQQVEDYLGRLEYNAYT